MVKNYGSDVSREQFEIIREDLEKAKKAARPRKVGLYSFLPLAIRIFCTNFLKFPQEDSLRFLSVFSKL